MLASFERCYAVAVQRRHQSGYIQLILLTGSPLQPYRITGRAPGRNERIVAIIV
ncbi:hypothetical protein GGR38_004673 [Novosphingobium sediminicola]|uniref:Uncharacterized protein n=2 Tax=Novosphingobium sediminicola TaxID=563162 RepID=A0A7W6CNN3_9SPHN|nr:hypothetical protein [Novosphingobium sediminicola]